jgi:trehalose 6-phosphate synthase
MEEAGGTWIAAALSNTDRLLARKHPEGRVQGAFRLRFLDLPRELHHLHYDVVSNEYLWFLFHYLFDTPHMPSFDASFARAWEGYRRVNEIYARAAIDTRADAVMFEDYHLMLAGSFVRRATRSSRPLIYFHHTPWCDPEYFSLLPEAVRTELLESMLVYDVIGFHARRWADAFVRCCERYVPGTSADGEEIRWKKRSIKLLVAPVPVNAAGILRDADDPAVRSWVASHDEMRAGRKLLLRVDRIDLSKNPLRGFLAFEQLLERRPELANEVVFFALLYPSRLSVKRYQSYYTECLGVVRRVNERFERKVTADVGPIHMLFEDDFQRSLGAMRLFDVLLVNPVFDGLNLVSKEGAVVNERAGSVILSKNAGAFEEIGSAVVPLDPFDVGATADAIEYTLGLSEAERRKRATKLKRSATRSTPGEWLRTQLAAVGL